MKSIFLLAFIISFTAHADQGDWFNPMEKHLIKTEIGHCYEYKNAGNIPLFNSCITSKLNSFDYIKNKITDKNVNPMVGNTICLEIITHNFEYGAKCMAAAIDLCKQDENGYLSDIGGCFRKFGNYTWMSNPAAMRLSFNRPIRKEEEIKKYIE